MVKVACTVLNGITIVKWKRGFDDGTGDGEAPMIKDGDPIRLRGPSSLRAGAGNPDGNGLEPVITEVPDEWDFPAWLEQNKKNPFVLKGLISRVEDAVPNGK